MAVSFGARGQGFTGNTAQSHAQHMAGVEQFRALREMEQRQAQQQPAPMSFLEKDVARAALLSQLGSMQDAARQTQDERRQAHGERARAAQVDLRMKQEAARRFEREGNMERQRQDMIQNPSKRVGAGFMETYRDDGQGGEQQLAYEQFAGDINPYGELSPQQRQTLLDAGTATFPGGGAGGGGGVLPPGGNGINPGGTDIPQPGFQMLEQLGERIGMMLRPPPALMAKYHALVESVRRTGTAPVDAVVDVLTEAENTKSLEDSPIAYAQEQAGASVGLAAMFDGDRRVAKSFENAIMSMANASSAGEAHSDERLRTRRTPGEFFLGTSRSSIRERNRRIDELGKSSDTATRQRTQAMRSFDSLLKQHGVDAKKDPTARAIIDNAMTRAAEAVRAGQPVESIRAIAQEALARLAAAQNNRLQMTAAGE